MAPRGADDSEMCPVCKSSSYLNRNLKFKINPECYHKMCTSCVDRIFSSGPAPCPVAGCGKTLRKNRFKEPRFSDLAIERECDIRARVAQILNHTEADFDTLRAFNDYEEWKETLIMDLVARKNVAEHEQKLKEHAAEHKEAIKANKQLELDHKAQIEENERLRIERSELSRAEARREYAEELAEREAGKREVVDKIMNANADVLRVAREAERVVERRAAARSHAGVTNGTTTTTNNGNPNGSSIGSNNDAKSTTGFGFAGLKKFQPKVQKAEGPYDPFDGLGLRFKYYSLNESYLHPKSNAADNEKLIVSGGYFGFDYQKRALREAHAGLGVFVEEEKA